MTTKDGREAVERRTPPQRRALMLVNRNAGRGEEDLHAVLSILADGGIQAELHVLPRKHAMPDLIRRHARDFDLLIIGGGDGTLQTTAPAIVEAGLPLGLLPLGTANDLARTLGLGPNSRTAARAIAGGLRRRIDLGEVNGELFWNAASIGLSTRIAEELSTDMKKRWGVLGYALTVLRTVPGQPLFEAEIRVDGGATEQVRALQVNVGNGRYHGGGLSVDRRARIDDGRLHGYSVEIGRLWQLMLLYPALLAGRQGIMPGVRRFSGTEIEIRTSQPMPVAADGTVVTVTPARFRVLPGVVEVFVPA